MRALNCLFIVTTVLLLGCGSKKNKLARTWFFTYSYEGAERRKDSLTPVSFLQLEPDGSYTRDFGKFDYGKWELKEDKVINLTSETGQSEELNFQFVSSNELQLITGKESVANFESPKLAETKVSPFSRENNLWRIPAKKQESEKEIKLRLLNHCKFWEQYFMWALETKLATVDVRSTPTAIKIYGNGFGLKPLEELPPTWVSYFYDTADCRKANEQIAYIFKHNNIAWAKTDNKFKMFIGAFQQLQGYLR
jgi:hypothetical protein